MIVEQKSIVRTGMHLLASPSQVKETRNDAELAPSKRTGAMSVEED
jgi:hypothetical protein